MHKVLYVSSLRARERRMLEACPGVSMQEVRLHFGAEGYRVLARMISIVEHAIKERPDVILMENSGVLMMAPLVIGKMFSIPVLVRVKGDIWGMGSGLSRGVPFRKMLSRAINYMSSNIILRSADVLLPISGHLGGVLTKHLGDGKRVSSVYISHDDRAAGSFGGSRKFEHVALTVTNFNYALKIHPLAEAIKNNIHTIRELGLKWVILGDGIYRSSFIEETKRYDIEGLLEFPGHVNTAPYYKRAAALLYISGLDGLPNVFLEAFSEGLPVIVNADCPAREFVERGRGFVVDIYNQASVRKALLDALEYTDDADAAVRNARATIETGDLSTESVCRQMEIAIETIKPVEDE